MMHLPESITPKKVAIYVRVSTEEQALHGYSIDAQLNQLRKYCELYGNVVFREYVERGVSGKSIAKRFELQKLLRDAEEGLFDEVLVLRFNRLARNTVDLLQIVGHLRRHNISFRSFVENFETDTPTGKFALSMMGAVGELERDTILGNSKMGLHQRVSTGGHIAKAPLGYKVVVLSSSGRKRVTRIDIVPEEAAIVKRIFDQFASGRGLKSIANELNHDGLVTKAGNPFSICAIRDIIENPFYISKVRYCRYTNWNEKRRKGRNPSPIIADGKHPAIIDEQLWNKVQFLRDRKAHTSTKRFHGEYLLTGLLRCPKCGAAMTASRTNNKDKHGNPVIRMYYSCGNFRSKGSSVCSANSVRKQDAERYVFDRIRQVLLKPQILQGIVKGINDRKINRIKPLQDELEAIRGRIDEVQATKLKYLQLYESDQVDRKLFADRLAELEADLDRLHARSSELEWELDGDQAQPVPYETVRSIIERFDHLLASTSFDQRKTLLHLIISKITVTSDKKIDKIEMVFDEMTEQHFLSAAPSSATAGEGAFSFEGKAPKLNHRLQVII